MKRHMLGLTIGALLIFSTIAEANALSNGMGSDWKYYKNVTITNGGNTLTDYQILISLDSSDFPTDIQNNGEDIRFTDSSDNELNYWIESYDFIGKSAKIWAKVLSIPTGVTKIRMWYGNPNAVSSSNGDVTFAFFDDFLENTIGRNWLQGFGAGATITEGHAKIPMDIPDMQPNLQGFLYTTASYSRPLIVESRVKSDSSSQTGNIVPFDITYNDDQSYNGGQDFWRNAYVFMESNNSLAIGKGLSQTTIANTSQLTASNTYYIISAVLSSTNVLARLYNDERGIINSVSTDDSDYDNNRISLDAYGGTGYTYFDWVFVRKYAFPEPLVSIEDAMSMESPTPTASPTISPIPTIGQTINPTSGNVFRGSSFDIIGIVILSACLIIIGLLRLKKRIK